MGMEFAFKIPVSGWLPGVREGLIYLQGYVLDTELCLHSVSPISSAESWTQLSIFSTFSRGEFLS